MPVCDICNRETNWMEGYVLTTEQVLTSEKYWENLFTGIGAYMHLMNPNGDGLASSIQNLAAQSTGWLICEECSNGFAFDKVQAKNYAEAKNGSPPGVGSARMESVAPVAADVWKRLYGSWPSSIKVSGRASNPAPPENASLTGEQSNSSCFVATVVYGSTRCQQVEILRKFRDHVLLQNIGGRFIVAVYYRIGPFLAIKIASSPTAKFMCQKIFNRFILPFVQRKVN